MTAFENFLWFYVQAAKTDLKAFQYRKMWPQRLQYLGMLINGAIPMRIILIFLKLFFQSMLYTVDKTCFVVCIFDDSCDCFSTLTRVELFIKVFWQEC